ncbi:MAG: hypothetical protein LBD30_06765 [Verrucomicrobiales bacterium]|jgi:CRISPR-associated endonuclease Csn1|nr:hypothetical protein [Verrucomicrobiales bacterium]
MKEIPDDFKQRQLNDTRYICTKVKKYLGQLYARNADHQRVRVRVSKGVLTAALRKAWNLNTILSDDGIKNRADHRHHAIDAAVIAATSTRFMQSLSRLSAQAGKDGLASGIWNSAIQHRMNAP